MSKSYRTGRGSSAATSTAWTQICEACRAVIERAAGRRELQRFGLRVDASTDTLGRLLDDYQYGGWTGPRLLAMREWEEEEYGTSGIRHALGGSTPHGCGDEVERDVDAALLALLHLSRQIAECRPKGITRVELRRLLTAAQETAPALSKFITDAKARMKAGT